MKDDLVADFDIAFISGRYQDHNVTSIQVDDCRTINLFIELDQERRGDQTAKR